MQVKGCFGSPARFKVSHQVNGTRLLKANGLCTFAGTLKPHAITERNLQTVCGPTGSSELLLQWLVIVDAVAEFGWSRQGSRTREFPNTGTYPLI